MKQITVTCLLIILIGTEFSNSAWARGGGGYGDGHYGGGRGGPYGHNHYRGGLGYGHRGNYGGSGFGFYFGAPLYPYPTYRYRYPYYFPPAIVTVPAPPPVYIQQTPPPVSQTNPAAYWYYCNNPEGYYPYIKECPNGWQKVEPMPPPPSAPR